MTEWIDNYGRVVFTARHSFTLKARRMIVRAYGRDGAHVRVGRFSCVIVGDNIAVGEMYAADDRLHREIQRDSVHWHSHVRDRMSQLARVVKLLKVDHPRFSDIMDDINEELAELAPTR